MKEWVSECVHGLVVSFSCDSFVSVFRDSFVHIHIYVHISSYLYTYIF